ncbi:SDR family NAD(P)-dependent oxidoreductase [Selenomonas sp. KH1T6]|uniref:SDR family NAD(P)-dependent oxidoreductase n=1 Tax=Selenomonas sp. KH1T6 TaxID=3158784 RepID=UPI0008A746EB|nr:NAD(P)-dependent dehydrogenase, short-chain alcohol dehydrogenase family [Selenomonas ruminantium]
MSTNIIDLADKSVIIAGASSGIGRKTAEVLAKMGTRCILIARRQEMLKEVTNSLVGTGHSFYAADLSQVEAIEPLIKHIACQEGPLDGLVYCCGIADARPVKMAKPDFVSRMMGINFFAFYELVRSLVKRGRFNPGMSIVGLSSCASVAGGKSQSVYSASKAAMDAAVRVMAQEFADKSIRINTIRPGSINTSMYQMGIQEMGSGFQEQLLEKQFLGIGETEDIANMVAFLLAESARFITGAHFSVDGGYTCH